MRVYLVTNKVNGKVYVGQTTKTITKRLEEHVYKAISMNADEHLHKAIRKYGPEEFSIELVRECQTKWSLNMLERKYVFEYKSWQPEFGYNKTFGGDAVPLTEEGRKKISQANKGRKLTEEDKEKKRQAAKNRPPISEETRAKMRESHKVRAPVSEETKRKQSEAHLKRYQENPQLRLDCADRMKVRVVSEETKKKISVGNTGKRRKLSDKTRKKMSESHLQRYAENPDLKTVAADRLKARGGMSPEALLKVS